MTRSDVHPLTAAGCEELAALGRSGLDESRMVGISAWIPLIDSHADNGTLHILPGSHRMDNFVRP
ncbi:MAG TPA: phytanoyl-CoA dioxygenase family protein, partial [Actinotalea sp.]|nr:phytanoyl-CoA dioxygenase family protein [Actinotalea sp.]